MNSLEGKHNVVFNNKDKIKLCLLFLILLFLLPLCLKSAYAAFKEFEAFNYVENHSALKMKHFYDQSKKQLTLSVKFNKIFNYKRYMPIFVAFNITSKKLNSYSLLKNKNIIVKRETDGKIYISKIVLNSENSKGPSYKIGFGSAQITIPSRSCRFSYRLLKNMNNNEIPKSSFISIIVQGVDEKEASTLNAYIHYSLTSESAVPFIFLIKFLFYFVVTFFFIYFFIEILIKNKRPPVRG